MNSFKEKNARIRYNLLTIFVYIIGIVLLLQLFNLQIVKGESYRETSNTRLTRESTIKAARGNIIDRSGNKLVTTKMGYALELYKTKIDTQTLNETILKIITILEKNKDTYVDRLPIKVEPFEFIKTEEEQKKWKKENNIDENATAQQAFESLKSTYKITETDNAKARKIMVVRYEISRNGFSNIKPVTISKSITKQSAMEIKEQNTSFPGANVVTEPIITYPYGTLASHLLGYVGMIKEEEYNEKKEIYDINDVIGRTGIQYSLEKYLKGTDGIRQVDMAVDGTITEEVVSKEAIAGNDVVLTIDANLQKATEKALLDDIKKIASGGYGKKYDANAGAAIVMNVNNGEVLALASYPDYEPELFTNGISEAKLKEYDQGKNIYNRAISGTYAPGSTFKMVTATAGLETGVIDLQSKINDTGVYPRAHNPVCWYWTEYRSGHGYINVTDAIKKSCNYFFYELGYRTGIDPIAKYAKYYGLGMKTGIELLGESSGILATKEYCMETENRQWQLGDTLSAVIGQSYNNFTPIQMARYISMLSNGGNPVDVTLIKSVQDANGNKINPEEINNYVNEKIGNTEENTIEKLAIKQSNLKAILAGMKGVTSETGGTAYYIFSDFGMDIGGKTGSAETGIKGKTNGWFVGFAPYDNPEIAVIVLIENAGSGGNTAIVAKQIMQEYFGVNSKKVTENKTAIPTTQQQR